MCVVTAISGALGLLAGSGCASSSDSVQAVGHTAQVGIYSPPPPGIARASVGVPPFGTKGRTAELSDVAADQLTTLLVNTDRLDVIERAQLEQLLKEQDLAGIVKAGELAQQGEVRGVDYLALGKVTHFRVKPEKSRRNFGLGKLPIPGTRGALGAFDFTKTDSQITAEVGVDIRLVDPTSGKIVIAKHKDFARTDSIGAFGVEVLGVGASADADVKLDEDNKGLILRLALDGAVRDMLPLIDRELRSLAKTRKKEGAAVTSAAPGGQAASGVAPTTSAVCGNCGNELAAGAKFCAGCGTKAAEAAKDVCDNCGAKLVPGAKFCGGCGTKVSG